MKHLAYITSLLLLLLCSCSDDIHPDALHSDVPDGTPIEIVAATKFPEMNFGPNSRAMGDQPTADELLNSLKVNIMVFDAAGVMLQFIPPSDISIERIAQATNTVYFRVRNIYSSSQPRRLHFVVTSAPDIREIEGGEFISVMANETTVMPALMSEGNTDVYWGLSEQPQITDDMTLEMKVIRNFVKMSVESSEDTNKFKLLGYTVVNRPSKGTIAPYIYKDHMFASFLSPDNTTLKSYDEIVAQGYHGVNPAGAEASMTHTTLIEAQASLAESEQLISANKKSPYYFYERSQSETASAGGTAMTYLIVKGSYNGKTYYYKIDIGHNKSGKFEFYDLLRNFHYTINITEVGGPGAETLEAAMAGVAHNNISASVVTRDLFAISYHNELIVVSDTRVIFTEQTANYKLRFRYTVPEDAEYQFAPAQLKVYDLNDETKEYDMSGLEDGRTKDVDLSGEVVASATLSKDTDGWYALYITTKNIPPDARRWEQNLRVYYSGGTVNLGRTVTLMLRQPWHLTDVTNTQPTANAETDEANYFAVNFSLPSGLVSSQFPLTLTFESDKQNIYAKKGTDLHVAVGNSGFKGATTDNIILYEWNMPWSQYRHADSTEGGQYTAYFLTNTTSKEDENYPTTGIDGASNGNRTTNNGTTTFCIRIANKGQKYIEPYYVNVTRPKITTEIP